MVKVDGSIYKLIRFKDLKSSKILLDGEEWAGQMPNYTIERLKNNTIFKNWDDNSSNISNMTLFLEFLAKDQPKPSQSFTRT